MSARAVDEVLEPATVQVYRRALDVLSEAGVRHLLGGAFALAYYTGIVRHTKDLDLFVLPGDLDRALQVLAGAGFRTETVYDHWLAKAHSAELFVDIIFSSGNGLADVDALWFDHAPRGDILGRAVDVVPLEEMIWTKGYLMERERFDGADVAHMLRRGAATLDWRRLLRRFGPEWRILYAHLVLFGFIYPDARGEIPSWVMRGLARRMEVEVEAGSSDRKVCRGRLISRQQYCVDVEEWGYEDALRSARSGLSADQVDAWEVKEDPDADRGGR